MGLPPRQLQRGVVRTAAWIILSAGALGCGNSSGCDDFVPTSPQFEAGRTQSVAVEISDGGWTSAGAGGDFWSATEPVPPGVADGLLKGQATPIAWDRVSVDFGTAGTIEFTGPDYCY